MSAGFAFQIVKPGRWGDVLDGRNIQRFTVWALRLGILQARLFIDEPGRDRFFEKVAGGDFIFGSDLEFHAAGHHGTEHAGDVVVRQNAGDSGGVELRPDQQGFRQAPIRPQCYELFRHTLDYTRHYTRRYTQARRSPRLFALEVRRAHAKNLSTADLRG